MPSRNVTVPAGITDPEPGVTAALRDTLLPIGALTGVAVRVVAVFTMLTTALRLTTTAY